MVRINLETENNVYVDPGSQLKSKPNIGELWEIGELWDNVKIDVGNKRKTFLISGHGLVVGIHRNHDDFGDYYKVLLGGRTEEFLLSNFGEKIQ